MQCISYDSDLMESIRLVRRRFGLSVVVLHPCRPLRRAGIDLKKASSKSMVVADRWLAASQFSPKLSDAVGTIHKPPTW
jgi:hypothetical protein